MPKANAFPNFLRIVLLAAAFSAPPTRGGDDVDNFIRAFEGNPSYLQPLATLYGSMANSGWYQSASVPKGFGLYLGLPMNITRVSDNDRSFKTTFVDSGCVAAHRLNPSTVCREIVPYTAPTAFGRDAAPTMYTSNPDVNGSIDTANNSPVLINDGLEMFYQFNWFPYGMPQVGFSFYHTEVKLRALGLPLNTFSFFMPAIGIQHDFASFLPRILPKMPVNVSAAANFSWLSATFKPGGDIDGSAHISGFSHFLGLLVGYTYGGWAEVFMEAGWEGSSLQVRGDMVINDTAATNPENISFDMNIDGRNTFRAALNVAIHFGYDAVLGQNVGSEFGNQLSLLGFRLK